MENIKALLQGSVDRLPKQRSRIISVFLSSTFTDMANERDTIIKNLYPELKKYCQNNYNLQFQIVDMRWGIKGFSYRTNLASQFCLDEIKRCYEISANPCFVTIVSERYGSIFLPVTIEKPLFETIKRELDISKSDELGFSFGDELKISDIVSHCYELDENAYPEIYRLKDLGDAVIKPLEKAGRAFTQSDVISHWKRIEPQLARLLQESAQRCYSEKKISKKEKKDFFCSITEKEIFEGIFDRKDDPGGRIQDRALVFIRNLLKPDLSDPANVSKDRLVPLGRYFELKEGASEVDQVKAKQISKLKERLRATFANSPDNFVEYNRVEFPLADFQVENDHIKDEKVLMKPNRAYFKRFEDDFMSKMTALIDREQDRMDKYLTVKSSEDQALITEVLRHASFCKDLSERFMFRDDCLEKIKGYLSSQNTKPFVIMGESGCGKSSLMAKTASMIFDFVKPKQNTVCILRFLGTTPESSSMTKTLASIIYQLARYFEIKQFETLDLAKYEISQLRDKLVEILRYLSEKKKAYKIFIFLDSIDQLIKEDFDFQWMPSEYPTNTKFVLSFIADYQENLTEGVKRHCGQDFTASNYLLVEKFSTREAADVLKEMLKKGNRGIKQYKQVKKLLKGSENFPLFVKMIFTIISRWPSYYEPDEDFKQIRSMDECVNYIFSALERDLGKELVSRCLYYLTSNSDSGISDIEMEEALSLDEELMNHVFEFHPPPEYPNMKFPTVLWSRVKLYLKDFITEKEIDETKVYCWFHRKFQEIASERYLNEKKGELDLRLWEVVTEKYLSSPKLVSLAKYSKEYQVKTSPQPIEIKRQGSIEPNARRINKTIEIVKRLEDPLQSQLMLKYIFLDYKFMLGCFRNGIDLIQFWYIYDNLFYRHALMLDEERHLESFLHLIQFSFMNISRSLHKYPESLAAQMTSRLLSYYGFSSHVKRFVDDCDRSSYQRCALVATFQNQRIYSANIQDVFSLHRKITAEKFLDGEIELFLCENTLVLYKRNDISEGESAQVLKEINLPKLNEEYEFLEAFERFNRKGEFGTLAASKHEIIFCDLQTNKLHQILQVATDKAKIKQMCLLGSHSVVVVFENSSSLYVYKLDEANNCYYEQTFENGIIESIGTNVGKGHSYYEWYWNDFIILSVVLSSNCFHILKCSYGQKELETNEILDNPLAILYSSNQHFTNEETIDSLQLRVNLTKETRNCIFEAFVCFGGNSFALISLKEMDQQVQVQRISLDNFESSSNEFSIFNFYSHSPIMIENSESVFILDMGKQIWFSIPGSFKRVIINSIKDSSYVQIYAYTATFLNVYLAEINMDQKEVSIITLLEHLSFSDEIFLCFAYANSRYDAVIISKAGNIFSVNTTSAIGSNCQSHLYDRVDHPIELLDISSKSPLVFTQSNSELHVWNYLDGRVVKSFKPDLSSQVRAANAFHDYLLVVCSQEAKLNLLILNANSSLEASESLTELCLNESGTFVFAKANTEENALYVLSADPKDAHQLSLSVVQLKSKSKSTRNEDAKYRAQDWKITTQRLDHLKSYVTGNWHDEHIKVPPLLCLSGKSNYLVAYFANELIFVDVNNDGRLIKNEHLEDISDICSIHGSDDLLLKSRKTPGFHHVSFQGGEMQSLRLRSFEYNYSSTDIKLFKNVLFLKGELAKGKTNDASECELVLYGLNSARNSDDDLVQLFSRRYSREDNLSLYTLTPNMKYLITYEASVNKLLRVYRIDSSPRSSSREREFQEIAALPLFSPVNSLLANERYVVLSIQDQRIISYLIADPEDDHEFNMNLIQRLPSRNINQKGFSRRNLEMLVFDSLAILESEDIFKMNINALQNTNDNGRQSENQIIDLEEEDLDKNDFSFEKEKNLLLKYEQKMNQNYKDLAEEIIVPKLKIRKQRMNDLIFHKLDPLKP